MNIIVHHLENSRSQRVLWLLEELRLPYRVVRYSRDPISGLAPDAARDIHPLGKLPVIQDGNLTIAESVPIFEHILNQSDVKIGRPTDLENSRRYQHFVHYAEGSLMPPLFALLVLRRMGEAGQSAAADLRRSFAGHLAWMDAELTERPWFAGESFTAVDIMMSFPLEAARQRGGLDGTYPNLNEFLGRIHSRPACRAAIEAGGPYALA
ncbi:glutathione S-transferase [Paraburkholderia hospita]|uniref:Glutathione S-transferase n=1 Tax=Paraburkholderia hospita TaxID=169430 RepID=A0ABN0FFT5_9BURK|nr:glutathione S-transferase [Paraburkholderia hospita]EIM97545.1 glutathione S-transferase [Paraburkholderia hospita]OUL92483.1 glutathione S-transferase [Paraburkholderia hospita]